MRVTHTHACTHIRTKRCPRMHSVCKLPIIPCSRPVRCPRPSGPWALILKASGLRSDHRPVHLTIQFSEFCLGLTKRLLAQPVHYLVPPESLKKENLVKSLLAHIPKWCESNKWGLRTGLLPRQLTPHMQSRHEGLKLGEHTLHWQRCLTYTELQSQ